jgi:hypothetical protein
VHINAALAMSGRRHPSPRKWIDSTELRRRGVDRPFAMRQLEADDVRSGVFDILANSA